MNSIKGSVIMTLVLAAMALPALAMQAPPGVPRGGPPSEEQREEIRKKMEAVKVSRLTEELKLDEKTAAKFIPVITALDRKRRVLMRENRLMLEELRNQLSAPQPDENKLKTAVGKLEKNHREIMSLRDKEISAIKDNLTVTQQARYFLFHQEFQREMRGMVESARKGTGKGRGPGMGGASTKGQP